MYSKFISIATILLCFILISCGSKKKNEDFSVRNQVLLDSLGKEYTTENKSYAFSNSSWIYADTTQTLMIDTLPLANRLFIDTTFYIVKDSFQVEVFEVKYVKNGKVKKGIMSKKDIALQSFVSKKDAGLLFMANYVPIKDEAMVVLKSVRNNQLETELALDTGYMSGFYMDLYLADSLKLAHTTELLYLNTYYPACGYASTHYYIDYTNKKFKIVLNEVSWFDAPYYNSPSIYFPTVLNSKNLLYKFWGNIPERDTLNNPITYTLPTDLTVPLNELIYVEYWQNRDSTINGKTLTDQYDEPALFDICSEKKLYRWTGEKLELVR
jgi:hypothetical protein